MMNIKSSLVMCLLALLTASCDNIDENDRYIKEEKPVYDNPRTLLIMEFTGNNCSNCPIGAKTVEEISEDEPGRVIAVGMHPKGTTYTTPMLNKYDPQNPYIQDFGSDIATAMNSYYQPSAFPCAVFNGNVISGSIDDWQTRAFDALKSPAAMAMIASCSYDQETNLLSVEYSVDFTNNVNDELNVSVWVMENNIPGTQLMPDGKPNYEYIHNHVLRTSLTGDWGVALEGKAFDSDSNVQGKVSGTIDPAWNPFNCQAVAFVSRRSDHEVLQACVVDLVDNL